MTLVFPNCVTIDLSHGPLEELVEGRLDGGLQRQVSQPGGQDRQTEPARGQRRRRVDFALSPPSTLSAFQLVAITPDSSLSIRP